MSWSGIPRERVVAVVAAGGGLQQVSTGFVLRPRLVLTARHCVELGSREVSKPTRQADLIRVVGAFGESGVSSNWTTDGLDVAVLELDDGLAPADLEPVIWGRVDRTASGRLLTADVVGYPQWQEQVTDGGPTLRDTAEVRGVIRALEGTGSGMLTVRDRDLENVGNGLRSDPKRESPWGGLSGAAVFAESGHLLGIVVEHRPNDGNAALRILSVDRITASGAARPVALLLGVTDLREVPWAYPDPGHALADAHGRALRRQPPDGLRERDRDLVYLAARIRREPWTWVMADAFAGKTALLATLVANPPRGVAVVSCFIRRLEGLASAEYVLDTLNAQLAALTWGQPFTPQAHDKTQVFNRLLEAAATACSQRGERLAVIVDGLDEYDPQASVSLGIWLPTALPTGATMLVAGREGCVPVTHPLSNCTLPLTPFEGSKEAWAAAYAELEQALRGSDPLVESVATFIAATGGDLTEDELAELCSLAGPVVSADQVSRLVDQVFDRTLGRTASHGAVVFTHPAYGGALTDILGPARLDRARATVDGWIDPMRAAAWGGGTRSYALGPYGRHLRARLNAALEAKDAAAARASAQRLTDTVSSLGRWLALLRAEGTPVAGDTEVVESAKALLDASDAGWIDPGEARLNVALVGLSRGMVRGRVRDVAGALAHAWAMDGRLERAMEMAGAISEPDARAWALADAVGGAARAGAQAATVESAVAAALGAAGDAGPYCDPAKGHLADVLCEAGWFAAAGAAAATIERDASRAQALARVARHAAAADQPTVALALAEVAAATPVVNDNADIFWAMADTAEAFALCGDTRRAGVVLDAAGIDTKTGFGKHELKYRWWADDIIEVGRIRVRARSLTVGPSDRTLADLAGADPVIAEIVEHLSGLLGPTQLELLRAVHLVVVWSVGLPIAARELAESVVDHLGSYGGGYRDQNVYWDQRASWVGATPAELTRMLIDAGMLDAALGILGADLTTGDWYRHADALRARLVRKLGGVGRLDDAVGVSERIGAEARVGSRLAARAWAGAECLAGCRSNNLVPYLEPRARAVLDDAIAAAAQADDEDRRAMVRRLVSNRLDPAPVEVAAPRTRDELEAILEQASDMIREATARQRADNQEWDDRADCLDAIRWHLETLAELVDIDPGAAAAHVEEARELVRSGFGLIEGWLIPPVDAFHAAAALVRVLHTLGHDGARALAEEMADRIDARVGALDVASCLSETIPALERVDALDPSRATQLIDLTWACRDQTTWTWHGPCRLAVTLAHVSAAAAPLFAATISELVREDLRQAIDRASTWELQEWYQPALEALRSLVANEQTHAATEVAQLLMERGSDSKTLWFDRSAIHGGLVRAAEPNSYEAALRRFLTEDAFPDHVDCLPLNLLRRLADQLGAKDRDSALQETD